MGKPTASWVDSIRCEDKTTAQLALAKSSSLQQRMKWFEKGRAAGGDSLLPTARYPHDRGLCKA